jgi:hypothetical protein
MLSAYFFGTLPNELQDQIFWYVDKEEVKPFFLSRFTYASSALRYYRHIQLKSPKHTMKFCDFVLDKNISEARKTRRAGLIHLIREITLHVPEYWIVDKHNPSRAPDPVNPYFYHPTIWKIEKVKLMLKKLDGVKVLRAITYRPELQPHVAPASTYQVWWQFREILELPRNVTTFEVVESQAVCRGSRYGPCNIRLFKPNKNLRALLYKSCQTHAEAEESWGTTGSIGFWKGLPAYAMIQDLTIIVGENDGDICNKDHLLSGLQCLPHLTTLDLRRTPYKFGVGMTPNWPAQLPTLRVLKVPLRNFLVYLVDTTAANKLRIEVLVDRKELCYYKNWTDYRWVRILLGLMEEAAFYFEQRWDDERSLSMTPVNVSTCQTRDWIGKRRNSRMFTTVSDTRSSGTIVN